MLFLLSSSDYRTTQLNTTRVKVYLRNGIAEILDKHQDLMGKVENNLVEIETNFENKIEKFLFILQEAVFIVSTKGLDSDYKGTTVCIYAKSAYEINGSVSLDELSKKYEQQKAKLNEETSKEVEKWKSSKILLLQQDIEYYQNALRLAKAFSK